MFAGSNGGSVAGSDDAAAGWQRRQCGRRIGPESADGASSAMPERNKAWVSGFHQKFHPGTAAQGGCWVACNLALTRVEEHHQ